MSRGQRSVLATLVVGLLVLPGLERGAATIDPDALPLVGEAPPWFTPEVAAKTRAYAAQGLLYDVARDAAVEPRTASTSDLGWIPGPDYLFIRPGALMISPNFCTLNFVYNESAQIGSAGHCVSAVGQEVVILAAPTLLTVLGTVASFRNAGIGKDWALIDIDPRWRTPVNYVSPNVAYVGGPNCGAWDGDLFPEVENFGPVKHVGHGMANALVVGLARTSVARGGASSFQGIGLASGGDSGSPVLQAFDERPECALGQAFGILTHCLIVGAGPKVCNDFRGTDVHVVPATVTNGFSVG